MHTPPEPVPGPRLIDLPDDLLLLILSTLEIDALVACKQVCSALMRLVNTRARLQLTIELGINALIEGPAAAKVCAAARLKALREHGARVRACRLSRKSLLEGSVADAEEGTPLPTYGANCFGEACSYYVRDAGGNRVLNVHVQPSLVNSTERKASFGPIPEDADVLAVDVSQDLVVVQHSDQPGANVVRFYSLSEGWQVAHPAAANPALCIPFDDLQSVLAGMSLIRDVKVYGRHLVWNVVHAFARTLEVWDWRAGIRVWGPIPSFDSCTFLDSEHILMLSVDWDKLVIHRFVSPQSGGPSSQPSQSASSSNDSPVIALELPWAAYNCSIDDSVTPPSPTPPPSALFWPDPAQRAIAVSFNITSCPSSRCILFIPYRTFRKYIAHAASASARPSAPAPPRPTARPPYSASAQPNYPVVPWHDWSERGSLLLQDTALPATGPANAYYPHGSQLTVLAADPRADPRDPTGTLSALTFDVNPWARLRAQTSPAEEEEGDDDPDEPEECRAARARWGGKTAVEDFSEFRPCADLMDTALPRVACRGPVFPRPGVGGDRYYEVAAHPSGFTIVTFERRLSGERIVEAETLYA